jgi:mRNA-degrading endonuclease RelE of RelBE toxin-antitoxin system
MRRLSYRPGVERTLERMDASDRTRIREALERYASTGYGSVKALHAEFNGLYRLRVGKWRVIFGLESDLVRVISIDNRGQAY